MPDPAPLRDFLARHHRRLYQHARALLPDAEEATAAFQEAARRMGGGAPPYVLPWALDVVRTVAAERRNSRPVLPFSDHLFRQLAESADPTLDRADDRARALDQILHQLPPPERNLLRQKYELGLTVERIAAGEGRPSAAVVRDLAALHESLVAAVRAAVPDGGPEPPGGAADLGRMTGQLLDGTISDDSRLVLETLLLADAPAQAHYRRHVALITDLTWAYRGVPEWPAFPGPARPSRLTRRELLVTVAFVVCCVVTLLTVVFLFTGWLG